MLNQYCRTCANTIKDNERAANLYHATRGKYLRQLRALTGEEYIKEHGLPQRICERCQSELDLALKFRERCLFSQKYLYNLLKKLEPSCNKAHHATQSVKVVKSKEFEKIIEEDLQAELEFEIETEQTLLQENASQQNVLIGYKKDAPEVDEEDEYDSYTIVKDVETITNKLELEPEFADFDNEIEESILMDVDNLSTDGTVTESNAGRLLGENANKKYICDICAFMTEDRFKFNAHLTEHDGRKRYPCEFCDKAFFKKTHIKRHMVFHIGDRPHKCGLCEKRFADRGTKLRHERAHANERPYPCIQCGRTCSTSDELKLHIVKDCCKNKLICVSCNKSFTHLSQYTMHKRSAFHKNKMRQQHNQQNIVGTAREYDDDSEDPLSANS